MGDDQHPARFDTELEEWLCIIMLLVLIIFLMDIIVIMIIIVIIIIRHGAGGVDPGLLRQHRGPGAAPGAQRAFAPGRDYGARGRAGYVI